jgi:hypothetical protein
VPLDEGNEGGTGGTSLRLQPSAGGRWSAARGAATSWGAAARSEEGDDPEGGLGRSGPRRPGDAHWAGAEYKEKGKRPVIAWVEVKAFGLKWELGSRFSFLNLNQVLSSKIKGFKYF